MKLRTLLSTIKIINSNIITVQLYSNDDLEMIVFEIPGYECLDDNILEQEVEEIRIFTATTIKINLAAVDSNIEPDPEEP